MLINKTACFAAFGVMALAQPIPVYKDQEDYCNRNPDMPTCIKGKPLTVDQLNGYLYKPKKEQTTVAAPQVTAPSRSAPVQAIRQDIPQSRRLAHSRNSAGPVVIQPGALDWRFAHPHPDLLIGMDIENLLGSELMRTLLREWAGKLGATAQEQEKMLTGLGESKRVLISILNKDMLAMMVGNFGNLPDGPVPGGLQFTRLSSDVVLMGTEPGRLGALTRLKVPALANAQQEEAKLMAQTYDFWVWGRGDGLAGLNGGIRGNSPVSKIKLGVYLRDGFNLQMILDTPDGATAARVLEGMQKGAPRGMVGAVEGNSVRYAMVLDRDAALQRLAGFMTDSVGKQFAPLIAAARQISGGQARAARPAGKVIIDGLDDGPKEVPLAQKQ